jgi:hypothetical protein
MVLLIGTPDFAVSDSWIQRTLLLLIRFMSLKKEYRDRAVGDNWPSSVVTLFPDCGDVSPD